MHADQPAADRFGVGSPDSETGIVAQQLLPDLVDHEGRIPVGVLFVLADHALGSGGASFLARDEWMVTSHLHLEALRRIPAGAPRVLGRNTDTQVVDGSAFCTAELGTPGGDLIARTSGRFAIVKFGNRAAARVAEPQLDDEESSDPLDPGVHPDWTTSPVHRLLAMRVLSSDQRQTRVAFGAGGHLANDRSGIHGGVGALIAERAAELAVRAALGASSGFRPVELRVLFLRPVAATGAELVVDTEVGFVGRTTVATSSRLFRSDGKVALQLDAVHLIGA